MKLSKRVLGTGAVIVGVASLVIGLVPKSRRRVMQVATTTVEKVREMPKQPWFRESLLALFGEQKTPVGLLVQSSGYTAAEHSLASTESPAKTLSTKDFERVRGQL